MNALASTFADADAALSRLADRKNTWINVSIEQRIDYLQRCLNGILSVAESWVEAGCHLKGIDPKSSLAGEEWIAGPCATVSNVRLLIQALQAKGQPQPVRWRTLETGQQVAQVFPDNRMDQLLWLGFRGEVWIEPNKPTTQGWCYREKDQKGRVALVLGAGNISSIAPMDSLYKLFVENQVVLLKPNPVNDYLGAILERAFHPLKDDGFFEIVYGSSEMGHYLCHHPQVDTVHITGSHQTHQAIVWGSTTQEREQRQQQQQPLLNKPITSELGNITPILVVPGKWSHNDLVFQARHVAAMVTHNASFNCVAGKVLVLAQGWPQREAFLSLLRQELANTPPRNAYYPGAHQRYQTFLKQYPQAEVLGEVGEHILPWTLIRGLNEFDTSSRYALCEEAFCGILAEFSLPIENDPKKFLQTARYFAEKQISGELACVWLIDPITQKRYFKELENAISQQCYGNIGINVWPGTMFYFSALSWGAFLHGQSSDTYSGRGFVHNAYLFDYPQKSVMWAPFRIWPTPPWFANHRNLKELGQQYLDYEAQPQWSKVLKVSLAALKG